MSTNTYDTSIAHTTNAEFRSSGLALHNALTAVGLTQTSDSGQIDWSTATIPAAGASGGFEIWRFNDSLQATAPIFIRLDFGSGSGSYPQIWAQIGSNTDGFGTLTGTISTALAPVCVEAPIDSLITPYVSYVCYNATVGFLGIAFKLGSVGISSIGRGLLMIGRSCNSSGSPTATGATIYTGSANPARAQSLRFVAPTATYNQHQNYAVVVGDVMGSLVAPNVQVYLNWAHYPRVEPIAWCCSLITDEFPRGTTFLTSLVGSTARTFVALGQASPQSSYGAINAARFSFGMLFE